jgi:hypothetical protein
VKNAWRIAAFLLGTALLVLGWHKGHSEPTVDLQNPGTAGFGSPSAVLIVVGAFLALLAFAPSQQTLGRWMSLKRKHQAPPAQFRRRRRS